MKEVFFSWVYNKPALFMVDESRNERADRGQ